MLNRCEWCLGDDLYIHYHDYEWGVPVREDQKLFEFLILEGAQAGLSWITILRKREHYRKAFDNFDAIKIASYDQDKVEQLMGNSGIIRNRLKIESAINNARAFLTIQQEFGSFSNYIWGFFEGKTIQGNYLSIKEVPAMSTRSIIISKQLKKRGFNFVGPTIIYSLMQATGMVNDHLNGCHRYRELGGG